MGIWLKVIVVWWIVTVACWGLGGLFMILDEVFPYGKFNNFVEALGGTFFSIAFVGTLVNLIHTAIWGISKVTGA